MSDSFRKAVFCNLIRATVASVSGFLIFLLVRPFVWPTRSTFLIFWLWVGLGVLFFSVTTWWDYWEQRKNGNNSSV